MAVNMLEGKRFFGVIVGGGDNDPDPQKMGRVRVAVPSVMGPNINVKELPWCQLGSTSNDTGPMSFDRPPQEGTMVSIYFPGGSKSSMLGMVDSVYSSLPSYGSISGNVSLVNTGWLKEALNVVPSFMYGLPSLIQDLTGVTINNDNPAPSLRMKTGIPTNAAKVLQQFYSEVTNISTATINAMTVMSSLIGSLLNSNTYKAKNILDYLDEETRKELLKRIPKEVLESLTNYTSIAGSFSPCSGTNFVQSGNRINIDAFKENLKEELLKITSIEELYELLFRIETDSTFKGLDSLGSFDITLDGTFGPVKLSIDKDGNIEADFGEFLTNALSLLSSLSSQIDSAIQMLSKSSILSDTITRLSPDKMKTFKTGIETVATSISTAATKARTFFGD